MLMMALLCKHVGLGPNKQRLSMLKCYCFFQGPPECAKQILQGAGIFKQLDELTWFVLTFHKMTVHRIVINSVDNYFLANILAWKYSVIVIRNLY